MRRLLISAFLTLLLAGTSVILAQEETPEAETSLQYGARIEGTINNQTPREAYYFEGLRGEFVSISVEVVSGNLDPVLAVLDNSGNLITSLDDAAQSRSPRIDSLRIPRSDRYYVVVGRFGYGVGSTSGNYELSIDRVGISFESGSTLRYGDSVINNITNMNPQLYYSFRAERGDIVNIEMQRVAGNLDPYLQIVNNNAFVIAVNDEILGSGSLDAKVESLVIEEAGTYVIIASRFGQAAGTSTGSFVLTVDLAQNSGLGNSVQAAVPILPGSVTEGELNAGQFARYYTFQAAANDLVTIRMNRIAGSLDSFLVLADASLQELASDDDGGGGQNAQISQFVIPNPGVYYVIATRFDREAGTSEGTYRLELQSLGNAFDNVAEGIQRISYGTTVTGRIDETVPQILYAFWGVEGDVLTVSMDRGDGDLDPVLSILDDSQRPLVNNDDGGGGQNARIERFVIPETGTYYVRAARYSGDEGRANTSGSFILVLARRFN
jgi:hypothetical protein